MNLYLEEFVLGIKEAFEAYSKEPSIFEIKGDNMFPQHEGQQMWQFDKDDEHVHFKNDQHTYSFKGKLDPHNPTYLDRVPTLPFPDMFNGKSKTKAQVHRSSPGSIYFTLQEGKDNPTYTFRHSGGDRWQAIPKAKKVKKQLENPPYLPNINVEKVKEAMLKELEVMTKEADGGLLDFFNHSLGSVGQGIVNLPGNLITSTARLTGPVTELGDNNQFAHEPFLTSLGKSGLTGLGGSALGLGYHALRRKLYNSEEENQLEDQDPDILKHRLLYPGLVLGGMSLLGRTTLPNAVNNSDRKMF